ncbi:S-adenosyl-L-methionine-dependent methyltransferase [Fomitiporia mediterranea MF3/22]|uniref:S-adenosyl-L-methionine-dependent methyltransferase n=1 Tax=Fomitiporia mediterranea (strain MF3/22) TaxID=694068 RepID=UPI0004409B59|nr:S-adenosyl-L-methionine-dependent methyltransferase [Fomitiporia mediterranea MF3/22]EJD04475.1 S-adenosyl-L-methionine-dependent methyltransferase [Fomitiporia mediterranea MF3/22]
MTVRTLEFYSGIGGGLHRALELSNVDASVVRAYDWDQTSCRVYEANYGPGIVRKVDISTLTALDLASENAPLWLLSPSCQPYTVLNPSAKGSQDPRAKSFLHLVQQVIPELARIDQCPKWILVENVAGFEASSTRKILLETLHACNYTTVELLLTPLQFGIPNSRLRYYLLAKQLPSSFANDTPEDCETTQLRAYLDRAADSAEDETSSVPDRVLLRWGRLFDIVLPSSRRSCCFTRGYTQLVERAGSILQMNEYLDVSPQFSPANRRILLNILEPLRLRYFTPSELLRLFHFESSTDAGIRGNKTRAFVWPENVSRKSQYRLLGNSVNVEVVRRLVNYLFEGDEMPV